MAGSPCESMGTLRSPRTTFGSPVMFGTHSPRGSDLVPRHTAQRDNTLITHTANPDTGHTTRGAAQQLYTHGRLFV